MYYDTSDDLESVISKAEGDVELIEYYLQEFKGKIEELREFKREESEIEENEED